MRKIIWREFTIALLDILRYKKNKSRGLLHVNLRQYHGPEIELRDGTSVRPGDSIGELHLSNSAFFNILRNCSSDVQAVMKIKKEMKQELTQLAEMVQQNKVDQKIKAFFGITIFHQGARLLGFDIKEIDSAFWRLCYKVGQLPLFVLIHPLNWIHPKKKNLSPKRSGSPGQHCCVIFSPHQNPSLERNGQY